MLIETEESLPDTLDDMSFPGRKLSFPIVLDDKWNREALSRYMRSARDKAVYLPSNIDYLARNNGVEDGAEHALRLLIMSPWVSHLIQFRNLISYPFFSSFSGWGSTLPAPSLYLWAQRAIFPVRNS